MPSNSNASPTRRWGTEPSWANGTILGVSDSSSASPQDYVQQKAAASGSSFYYAFLFLPPPRRAAITAFYAFCR